jgi:putative flippase GtrA
MGAIAVALPAPFRGRFHVLLREGCRYFAASVAALGVDYGLLVTLTEVARLPYLTSSAISYSCGAIVSYGLSVTLVFRDRPVADRRIEFVAFLGIGLAGLAVTQAILVVSVERLGMSYVLAKTLATGVSFALNFVARRAILFTDRRTREP